MNKIPESTRRGDGGGQKRKSRGFSSKDIGTQSHGTDAGGRQHAAFLVCQAALWTYDDQERLFADRRIENGGDTRGIRGRTAHERKRAMRPLGERGGCRESRHLGKIGAAALFGCCNNVPLPACVFSGCETVPSGNAPRETHRQKFIDAEFGGFFNKPVEAVALRYGEGEHYARGGARGGADEGVDNRLASTVTGVAESSRGGITQSIE